MDRLCHKWATAKGSRVPRWPAECPERLGRTLTNKPPRSRRCWKKNCPSWNSILWEILDTYPAYCILPVCWFLDCWSFGRFCWFFVDLSGIFPIVSSWSPPASQAGLLALSVSSPFLGWGCRDFPDFQCGTSWGFWENRFSYMFPLNIHTAAGQNHHFHAPKLVMLTTLEQGTCNK